MTTKKDHLKSAITEKLAPILFNHGFTRFKPKHFVRVEGDLCHSIAFQMSRYGDQTFYVHYYVNLLCAPDMDIESYRIGDRLSSAPAGFPAWISDREDNAAAAIDGVIASTQELILPWFANVRTVRDFIVEWVANPETKIDNLDMAVALLGAGYRNRAWWICDALSNEDTYVPPIDDGDLVRMAYAAELMDALASNTQEQLLAKWKKENIEKNKLSSLFAT